MKSRYNSWFYKGLFLLIIFIIFFSIVHYMNPIYPNNELQLIIWFFAVPFMVFLIAFFLLRLFYKKEEQSLELFKKLYYLLPIGFIYSLIQEFYHSSQHIWQNVVLYYGLMFVLVVFYIMFGQEIFRLLDKN